MHARDFVQRHCGVKGGGGGRAQEVMEAVEAHDIVLLCGETGCGKTTQVCPCLAALPRCVQSHAIAPELQLRLRQIQCTPRWIGRQSHRQVPWWLPYWADLFARFACEQRLQHVVGRTITCRTLLVARPCECSVGVPGLTCCLQKRLRLP